MLKQNVAILASDGCMSSIVSGIHDLFHIANKCVQISYGCDATYRYELKLISENGQPIKTFNSSELPVEGSLNQEESFDLIILVGSTSEYTTKNENSFDAVKKLNWIRSSYKKGAVFMCLGNSRELLKAADLDLKASKTIDSHLASNRLNGKSEKAQSVYLEDNVIFAHKASYFVDAIIHYVKCFGSDQVSFLFCEKVESLSFSKNNRDLSVYPRFDHSDDMIKKTQKWLIKNYSSNINISDIPSLIGMGERNFARRFKLATGKTPLSYLQEVRILAAQSWLIETNAPIYKISEKVGYADLSSFSRLFKKYTGQSMKLYREDFRSAVN